MEASAQPILERDDSAATKEMAVEELQTQLAIRAMMPLMTPSTADFALPAPMAVLREVADMLSHSLATPPEIRGDKDACLSIAYAAANWRMDPVAVASKAYLVPVKGSQEKRLAWEAQLIISLIRLRAPIAGELEIDFFGEMPNRYCRVRGKMRGSTKWSEVVSPTVAQVAVKNSPLWFSDPDQQLSYYTQRAWARRWCPEIILGVYAKDEMVDLGAVDITVAQQRDPDAEDEALPEVEVTVDGEDQAQAVEPDPEPSGGAEAAAVAAAKVARSAGKGAAPDDMPELRAWLADVQRQCLDSRDVDEIDKLWKAALADKNHGRIKAYDPHLMRAAYAAISAHVATLTAAGEEDGFPGK